MKNTRISLENSWKVAQFPPDNDFAGTMALSLDWLEAKVPGAVQYDLVAAGKLANPYESTKAAFASAWVAKSDWLYHNTFTVNNVEEPDEWVLHVDGVDTFSDVYVNHTFLGVTHNNYRTYDFVIPKDIIKSENTIDIRVKSHERMIEPLRESAKRLGRPGEVEGTLGKALIRRYQRSFFSGSSLLNLGTGVLGIGINRPVEIRAYYKGRISDYNFSTAAVDQNSAHCSLEIEYEYFTGGIVSTEVMIKEPETGEPIFVSEFDALVGDKKRDNKKFDFIIRNPKLWQPVGYGEPNLYNLEIVLRSNGDVIEEFHKKVGIKTSELIRKLPNGRNTFHLRINGKRVYAKGQNLIPLDYIKVYKDFSEYESLLYTLKKGGANLIRIWGGGVLEQEEFYEWCDREGIMVFQECYLHSNVYPDYDGEWIGEFVDESAFVIKRVRKHVSLVLLCGGNEQQEGWDEWGWKDEVDRFYGQELVKKHIPRAAAGLCPEIPYIYNSPHGGKWAQSPVEGECHNWGNFYNSTKDPLFVTETCWSQETYSRPWTLKKYMGLNMSDFTNFRWFDKWHEITSLPRLNRLPYSNWFDVSTLENYLYSLELEQARADYHALSNFRLKSPSNSGMVYWSFNKGGPLFQFGCVDYCGYPMMSYYVVKKLFSPVLAGIYRDIDDIYAVISNQSGTDFKGKAEIVHTNVRGEELGIYKQQVNLKDGELKKAVNLPDEYSKVISRTKEIYQVRLYDQNGILISNEFLYLCPFSELEEEESGLNVNVVKTAEQEFGNKMVIDVESRNFVSWLCVESDDKILCSDNYFTLMPGETKRIEIEILERAAEKTAPVRIFSLGEKKPVIL